ncbi:DUF4365 domain-containing protein [Nocardia terpenica]|uniref:DUF4365 domain-containing protein n=1 Tax=Nocardia terpenica TaxID=455432 RepID=UPI00142DAC95|nr:DUF4365 domain-containing protein [Nocardia terpenica]
MPLHRPGAHVNADVSIIKLRSAFLSAGWTVEELNSDYGDDLQVRIFDQGVATPYLFFVQAKHVEHGSKYRSRDGRYVSYRFERRHLESWETLWQPVVLTLWDVERDQIYWDIAQSLDWPPTSRNTGKCTIRFPTDNLLDEDGLACIRARTIARSQRHEAELDSVQVLIGRISELFDTEIDYDPSAERILITLPNGDADLTFFGSMGQMMAEAAERTGLDVATAYALMICMTSALLRCAEKHPFPLIRDGSVRPATGAKEILREAIRDQEISPDQSVADGLAWFIENHRDLVQDMENWLHR